MDNLQEYFLLFYDYDVEHREGVGAGLPDLIYSVCLGKIPIPVTEYLALEYGTALFDHTGYREDYFSSAKGFHDSRQPTFIIRSSLTFGKTEEFLCARAMERFERDSKSDAPHKVVTFMQTVFRTAEIYTEKFLLSETAENDDLPKPSPNEERNAKLYKLACDTENYPYWDDVVAAIREEYPDDYPIDKPAVQDAVKCYAKKHKKTSPPRRKPGRPKSN
jgi:hypothetical protein